MRFVRITKNGKVKKEPEERWVIEDDKKKTDAKSKSATRAKTSANKK